MGPKSGKPTVEGLRRKAAEGLPPILVTYHPSHLLRLKGREGEDEAHRAFVRDLKKAARGVTD